MEVNTQETPLEQAEAVFRNTLAGSVIHLHDPRTIKAELADLKAFAAKLKFQYLEQETRDKFLRYLLIGSNSVSEEDVADLAAANAENKRYLKLQKNELSAVVAASEDAAEDVVRLTKTVETRRKEQLAAEEEAAQLQSELDALLDSPQNENYKMLYTLNQMIGAEELGLHDALEIAQNALDHEKINVSQLSDRQGALAAERATCELLTVELHGKLRQLQAQVHDEKALGPRTEPDQVHAQWVRELNAILRRFVCSDIAFDRRDGVHRLVVRGSVLTFTRDLRVEHFPAHLLKRAVEYVNCAEGDDRFWKLLRLLSSLVLGAEEAPVTLGAKKEI